MNHPSLQRPLAVVMLCAAAVAMAGCATASKPDAMIATATAPGTQHRQTVSVSAAGGSETSAVGQPRISNEALEQALVASIEKNRTFSSVVKGGGGDYRLAVTVISLDQPTYALNFTVRMEAAWSLRKADGTVVLQESIRSEGMAGAGDSILGVKRLRLATEAAARDNIAAGLAKIGALKL